jgi:hypothetical protein
MMPAVGAMRGVMNTRKLYAAEATWKAEEWSIVALRVLAQAAWDDFAPLKIRHRCCPEIRTHRGLRYGGRGLLSFYDPDTHTIRLSRHQRDPKVLLHEMAHACGPMSHNRTFWNLMWDMFRRYGVRVTQR